MKGKISVLTIMVIFLLTSVVFAAVSYPYGVNRYGEKNVLFQGNMKASGLGVDWRPSNVNRHDLRFHNVNNNTYAPENGYLQTVQYDIQPLPNEPADKFSKKSGYHVVPLDEELIKDLAQKANGNPDYVWRQIDQYAQQAASSPSMRAGKVYLYKVENNIPYVDIGSVAYYSGGGDPDMVEAGGDGVSSPVFRTTYKTTNWPTISELKQEGQGLKIKATGYSIYNTMVSGKVTVNNDPATTKQVFTKSTPVNNYSVTFDGVIPFSQLSGLKEGENTVTLRIGDAYGRTHEKTIKVVVGPMPIPNLTLTKMEVSPSIPKKKDQAKIHVWVKNNSVQSLVSPLILQLDGRKVGEQRVGLAPGEEKKLVFTAIMPDATQTIARATVNPNRNEPAKETTFDDNQKEIIIPLDANVRLGKLNLILSWNKGPTKVQHAGQYYKSENKKSESRTYYRNPHNYDVVVNAYNDSKTPVTTTIKMTNTYKESVYVVPIPPPCPEGEKCSPPKPYWSIMDRVQEVAKTVTIPARDEVSITFSGIRPSYTHTTETDENDEPVEEPLDAPRNDTTHHLYFILNEAHSPAEETYDDNVINRTIQVNNKGVLERRGILIQ
ncbi:hypothetical protein ABEV55_14630 [Aneurinibacillus thermoaerophilus]|uniref:hypothetical protein n=1 Tax=Aneurinibacillus thermoaerophilus TaxID=143495 RepID=UPI002E202E04|nr:hypothetical protein [Aneurinibacillus thermoaerophilus]